MANLPTLLGERRIALLTPKPCWDQRDFEEYWLKEHGALVANTPGYGEYRKNYAQDHIVGLIDEALEFPYSGIASVRIPESAVGNFAATSIFRTRILPDEEHFLDRELCFALRASEYLLLEGTAHVKCMIFGSFSTDFDLERNLRCFTESDPPSDGKMGQRISLILEAPTDLAGTASREPHVIDWIEEAWFDSESEAAAHLGCRRALHSIQIAWAVIVDEHILFADGTPTIQPA